MQMSTEPEQRRPRGVSGSTICLQILSFFAYLLPGFKHFSGFAWITDTAVSMMHERPCYCQWQYYIVYFTRHFYDREHLSSGNKNVTDTQQGQQHYNISTTLLRDTALGNYEQLLDFITSYIIVLRRNKKKFHPPSSHSGLHERRG